MTDRINAFVVVLERDTRDDDAEKTLTALRMVKGVLSVEPHVAGVGDAVAETRARMDVRQRVWDALWREGAE